MANFLKTIISWVALCAPVRSRFDVSRIPETSKFPLLSLNCIKQFERSGAIELKLYGAFAKSEDMRTDTRTITKIIDEEFERIDPGEWK